MSLRNEINKLIMLIKIQNSWGKLPHQALYNNYADKQNQSTENLLNTMQQLYMVQFHK